MIKRLKPHFFALVVITLLGMVPLFYFRDGLPIFGGDHGAWPYNPSFQIERYSFLWNFRGGEGYNPIGPLLIPPLIFLQFLQTLGVSVGISEAILLSLLFAGSGLAMYFLAISLFGSKRRLLATTAAVIYLFNSERLLRWAIPSYIMFSAYLLYPLILALFINGLKSKKILRGAAFLVLGSLVLMTGNYMPSYFLIIYSTLFAYFVFYLLTADSKEKRLRAIKFAFISAILFISTNLWWLAPLLVSFKEGLSWFTASGMSLEWAVKNYSQYTSFLHLFQLHGWPGWGSPSFGYDAAYVKNPILILLSFLPTLLLIAGLVLLGSKKAGIKEKKTLLFLAAFYLLALFLSKGIHEPLEIVNWWLYRYIPGFVIFRTGFLKFGIMLGLSLSLLAGFGLEAVNRFFKKLKAAMTGKILVVVFFLLYLIYNFPFFTGEAILSKKVFFDSSVHHNIPDDYFEAAAWVNQMPTDFKLFSLPAQGNWEVCRWDDEEKYVGVDVLNELVEKPIKRAYVPGELIKDSVNKLLLQKKVLKIEKLLGLQNVKYLLLHNDIDSSVFGNLSAEYIRKQLANHPNIKLEQTFGKLDFYKLDDQYFLPQIFTPQAATYVAGEDLDFINLASFSDFEIRNEVYFANDIRLGEEKNEILERADNILINVRLVDPSLPEESYNQEVHFPFIRLTPDHLFYPYIIWKEKRVEAKTSDLASLIDLKLLYANKRLVEVESLLNQGKTFYIDETLTRYEQEMGEILSLLKEMKDEEENIAGILAKIGANIEKQRPFMFSLIHRMPEEGKTRIRESIQKAGLIEKEVFGKREVIGKDRRASQLRYKFNVPKNGEYSMFLAYQDLDKYWEFRDQSLNMELEFPSGESQPMIIDIQGREEGWVFFGKKRFEEGIHVLRFDQTLEPRNLSMSTGPLKVESNQMERGVALVDIKDFDPKASYRISFDYKTEKGEAPRMIVWESLTEDFDKAVLVEAIKEQGGEVHVTRVMTQPYANLGKDFDFQHYELTFNPHETGIFAGIAFLADQPKTEGLVTTNTYKDVKIEAIFNNPLVLKTQFPRPASKNPDLIFKRINPTKYKVSVKGATSPYTLIFSETFHPFWKAYIVAKDQRPKAKDRIWETWLREPIKEEKHLLVNGYANAWRIEKAGDYEIILEFWPQRLLYLGVAIAGLILLVFGLGYLVYEKRKVIS